ncbi:MAG: glucose-6-phosphate isomerase [Acidobacteriota bacterium]
MINICLTDLPEWKKLENHYNSIKKVSIKQLFKEEEGRGKDYSIATKSLYFDYSKNILNMETVSLLTGLAERIGLSKEIENMFNGEKINFTENRAVLHTALRDQTNEPLVLDGIDIKKDISFTLNKMKILSEKIRNGEWKGYNGKKIKNIINIGIGGSHLGPLMVCNALAKYKKNGLNLFFVSNVDGSDLAETLKEINPDETIFIIASKTFTTLETITNATSAKKWFLSESGERDSLGKHFIALTSAMERAKDFGIPEENILGFSDWVGGRYSLASAVGFSIMVSIGYENFKDMLKGFNRMDIHFRKSPLSHNIPVLMALIGVWYNNFFGAETHAIFPYDHYLRNFPSYVQQLEMESNGKSTGRDGTKLRYQTGSVSWGETGTNGQHSFFQLLHQGTRLIPSDFIGFTGSLNEIGDHHLKLMANFFAQTEALAFGQTEKELIKTNMDKDLIPFRNFEGNKPSNSILLKKLTPMALGELIALYEHKTFVQGIIWNINSFDQWGVELGKQNAAGILKELTEKKINTDLHDSSTSSLMEYFFRVSDKDEEN